MDMNAAHKQNGPRPGPGYQMGCVTIPAEKSDNNNNSSQNNRCQNNIDKNKGRLKELTCHVFM
jgi:hypothetical protein